MISTLVDTSMLIDIWRRGDWVETLENTLNHISTVTYIEFLQGASFKQIERVEEFLKGYVHLPIDSRVCELAIALIRNHAHTDGLRLADALIAATCIEHELYLLTINRKHFRAIDGLKLI